MRHMRRVRTNFSPVDTRVKIGKSAEPGINSGMQDKKGRESRHNPRVGVPADNLYLPEAAPEKLVYI